MKSHQVPASRFTRKADVPAAAAQKSLNKPPLPVLLVIVLDVTGSMQPYIDGLVRALNNFLDILAAGNLTTTLGLVLFRDEVIGERPEIYPLGVASDDVKTALGQTKAAGGGDDPESSLPAIMYAVDQLKGGAQQATRVVLHITDDLPHDPEAGFTARSVLEALKQHKIIFHCCAPVIEPYLTFANVSGGTLFPLDSGLDAEAFSKLLADVARQTVATVIRSGCMLSAESRAMMNKEG